MSHDDFDGDGPQPKPRSIRDAKNHAKRKTARLPKLIAVLDLETDPFDNVSCDHVYPFLAVIYSRHFLPVILVNENWRELMQAVVNAIENLGVEIGPVGREYLIYAHNGGRFDYMHLIHLLRGNVSFKGRAIMRARIGEHEIRDSLHIIPEALKNANQKKTVDYSHFKREVRQNYMQEIIDYCLSDCEYTLEIVESFVERFGTPITIGQAALKELKKSYTFDRLTDRVDNFMRTWFFGGRVECIRPGYMKGSYLLIDKNSMYPHTMATYKHPISNEFIVNDRITSKTIFVDVRCQNNGAFVARQENGDITANVKSGIFHTTIWELDIALKHNLIKDVDIIRTVEFTRFSDFSNFVIPNYAHREECKRELVIATAERKSYLEKEIKFMKYLLNNCFGKFAQNPRRFKQYYLTAPNEKPPSPEGKLLDMLKEIALEIALEDDPEKKLILQSKIEKHQWSDMPECEGNGYWIWSKPAPEYRFNNVATAASITGAARAELLDAIHSVENPMYVDTDSIICTDPGNLSLDPFSLGAWKREADICEFIGAGKKLYGFHRHGWQDHRDKVSGQIDPKFEVIRAKGYNNGIITWNDLRKIANGWTLNKVLRAPTIDKMQHQKYMTREVKRTADFTGILPSDMLDFDHEGIAL